MENYLLRPNIFSLSGDWYEFGNVDGNLVTGILTSLGSVFTMYLLFAPRKVNYRNTI